MENKARPRICEVLGVEVRESFTADYPYKDLGKMEVREDGNIDCVTGQVRSNALCYLINNPGCIRKAPPLDARRSGTGKGNRTYLSYCKKCSA